MTLSLEEMRRLVTSNGTGWDRDTKSITTREGSWKWDDERDCYVLQASAK